MNEDQEFVPPNVRIVEDGPGVNTPLSAGKPADNVSEDSPILDEVEVSEDSGPQTLDYTGPGETEYLITAGFEAPATSGPEEGTKAYLEKPSENLGDELAKRVYLPNGRDRLGYHPFLPSNKPVNENRHR